MTDKEKQIIEKLENKPVSKWNYNDLKKYTSIVGCTKCMFSHEGKYTDVCGNFFHVCPQDWKIIAPKYTRQEVETAKTILRVFWMAYRVVYRNPEGELFLKCTEEENSQKLPIESKVFPSVKCGESVRITEIAGYRAYS